MWVCDVLSPTPNCSNIALILLPVSHGFLLQEVSTMAAAAGGRPATAADNLVRISSVMNAVARLLTLYVGRKASGWPETQTLAAYCKFLTGQAVWRGAFQRAGLQVSGHDLARTHRDAGHWPPLHFLSETPL